MEANSHDRIKMIELWSEYDQKIFTTKNINIGTFYTHLGYPLFLFFIAMSWEAYLRLAEIS